MGGHIGADGVWDGDGVKWEDVGERRLGNLWEPEGVGVEDLVSVLCVNTVQIEWLIGPSAPSSPSATMNIGLTHSFHGLITMNLPTILPVLQTIAPHILPNLHYNPRSCIFLCI